MKLFTIGFTKTTAEWFFARLRKSGATALVDVRLNNIGQLAGFAKRDDLRYFTRELCNIPYRRELRLAPTQKMLDDYRRPGGGWGPYEQQFLGLMSERHIEAMCKEDFESARLLCSEDTPHRCHRILVAQYLKEKWDNVEIVHL